MNTEKSVLVLGAGIVGTSTALHLQKRGWQVTLIDRREPGLETSFGNAGVIERDDFLPLTIPRDIRKLVLLARNRESEFRYDPLHMPRMTLWLMQLFRAGSTKAVDHYAHVINEIQSRAGQEHLELANIAGVSHLIQSKGWYRLYRSERSFQTSIEEQKYADKFGALYEVVTPRDMTDIEPFLSSDFYKAIHWKGSKTVVDPGALVKAYADAFIACGGRFEIADAGSLAKTGTGWNVSLGGGVLSARNVVVCLGPWALDVLKPFGHSYPLAVKRGYHTHFEAVGNAVLNHSIVDMDYGYVLAPMEKGIRLTSGIELAARDGSPTPIQIDKLRSIAGDFFPLGKELDEKPWMGSRPCMSDCLPVIDQSPLHPGLWMNMGHGHLGLTGGPVTGRLIAEMMTGGKTVIDPYPFREGRFRDQSSIFP